MTHPTLLFQNVHKSFGAHKVLNGLNLSIFKQESFTLLGRSGVGKSVALKCLLGLELHDTGLIRRGQHIVTGLSVGNRCENMKTLGVVFQSSALFDSMNIAENIATALPRKTPASLIEKKVKKALSDVDLSSRICTHMPSELSGGMARRVAIARAIVHEPAFLFFDEPTTGLDPLSAHLIAQLIRTIHQLYQATTFVITHDLHLTRIISDRVGLLDQGRMSWEGHVSNMSTTSSTLVRSFVNAHTF